MRRFSYCAMAPMALCTRGQSWHMLLDELDPITIGIQSNDRRGVAATRVLPEAIARNPQHFGGVLNIVDRDCEACKAEMRLRIPVANSEAGFIFSTVVVG